jgi:hypothetical protein
MAFNKKLGIYIEINAAKVLYSLAVLILCVKGCGA